MTRQLSQLALIAVIVVGAVLLLNATTQPLQAGRPAPPTTVPVVSSPAQQQAGRPAPPTTVPVVSSPANQQLGYRTRPTTVPVLSSAGYGTQLDALQ